MPQITWDNVFRPTWTHLGLDAMTRGCIAKLYDSFEDYADSAAVQAVWTETGSAGNPTLVTAANALYGQQSMQVAVSGGTGTIYRTLDQNVFHGPFPMRIRFISFRATSDTNDSISIKLSDASDASLYREWVVTPDLGTDIYVDHFIDLNPNNEESWNAPTEGSTAWSPELIDRFEFTGLADGYTYVFDDIVFYYEYSLTEAIGFGTEPPTDDGADGSLHSKLRDIQNHVLQLEGTTELLTKYGPPVAYLNYNYTFGIELIGVAEQGIPSATEITEGNYRIDRVRDGTTTEIVASTGASESAGFIYATYQPLEDNWQPGDQLIVEFSGGSVTNDTDSAETLTADTLTGATTITIANAALFQVGQRVRIYDDTPSTEWNAVISIDSPTTLTVTAVANDYTTAQNAAIVLAERTLIPLTRIPTSVTYEPELDREQKRWVLADYDDFDTADADANTERWDVGYIGNTDGTAAGTEGGSADINTTTAGQLRVGVDPDASPTQAAYAVSRDEPSFSRYYTFAADVNSTIDATQATSSYVGLRVSAGAVDDPANYIVIAREVSSGLDRIYSIAEFGGTPQSAANAASADNAVAFKIERYGNVWNLFYSLTQYPNWQWVKLTQYEDANGDMTTTTSMYFYAESGGTVDAQTSFGDFDNYRYYIGSGALDTLLSVVILGSGTFTTSSTTVPADTGRLEGNNYWRDMILMPTSGVAVAQARLIASFANAGGVFTIPSSRPFTTAPAVGDEYVILAHQGDVAPAADTTTNQTIWDVVGNKVDTVVPIEVDTASLLAYAKSSITRGSGVFMGRCDSGMSGSTTSIVSDDLIGFGDNAFNTGYQMVILLDANAAGSAPEMEMRDITAYASATGAFTTEAFSANVEANDLILVVHNSIASLVSVYGIADASSTAALIRDAARTETNDWWNGQQILMLSGLARGQVRPIWDFLAATDDILVSPDFDAIPAAGDVYAILTQYSDIVPRTIDDTQNNLTSQVIGRKDDTTVPMPQADATMAGYAKANVARGMAIIKGTVSSVEGGSETTTFYSTDLIGFGDTYFNEEFSLQIVQGTNNDGVTRDITGYTSATGGFVTAAFAANVTAGDEFVILHKTQLLLVPVEDITDLVDMTPEVPDHSPYANLLTDDGDTSVYDRRRMSLEAITNALGIVNPAGTGFEGDGTGTTAYDAIVGVNEAIWMDGTAQQSLADMPSVFGTLNCQDYPRVDQADLTVAYLSLQNSRWDSDLIQATEFSGGLISIYRHRKGVDASWTIIVNGASLLEAAGVAYYTYTFPSASWQEGDLILYATSSCTVEIPTGSGQTFLIPVLTRYGIVAPSAAEMAPRSPVLFDDFEAYANDAAVQAVWTDGTGNATITLETASPQYGGQGMDVAIGAGGAGEARRGIAVDEFDYPYGYGNIIGVRFRALASTGTPTITVGLYEVADRANNYKLWNATLSTTSTIYEADFRETADATGAAWDASAIDEFNFGSLDANVTFNFDQVEFIYEKSVQTWLKDVIIDGHDSTNTIGDVDGAVLERLEALQAGLGVVAAAGTGFEEDGTGTTLYESVVGTMESTWMDGTTQQALSDMPYIQGVLHANHSPRVDQSSQVVATYSLHNLRPDADVIQTTEYSGTTITIARFRNGVDTNWNNIVTTQAMTEAAGEATYSYTFTSASWQTGDLIRYTVQSCVVEIPAASGQIFTLPTVNVFGIVISSSHSSNEATLPAFSEFWESETIEPDVWTTTISAGTLAIDATEAGYMKVGITPNLNQTGRLVSDMRFKVGPDQFASNTIAKKLVIEFECKFTNVANIDNTLSFFGLSATTAATRTTDNIIAFTLTGDALYATTDDASTENDAAAGSPTVTNWMKCKIEVYGGAIDFYVNETRTNNFTTNLPDQMMYLNFYVDTEGGGAGTFDLGPIRVYYQDVV